MPIPHAAPHRVESVLLRRPGLSVVMPRRPQRFAPPREQELHHVPRFVGGVGAVAAMHHVEVNDRHRAGGADQRHFRSFPRLVQGFQFGEQVRMLCPQLPFALLPHSPPIGRCGVRAELGFDFPTDAPMVFRQRPARRLQRPPRHIVAARHDARRAFFQWRVLRIVEQHGEAGAVHAAQPVHGVVGVVVAVLVQRLRRARELEVVVAVEVQVVAGAENRGECAAHQRLLEQAGEFRHAGQQIVVAARAAFLQGVQGGVHALVKCPRQGGVERYIPLADEVPHGAVVKRLFLRLHPLSFRPSSSRLTRPRPGEVRHFVTRSRW